MFYSETTGGFYDSAIHKPAQIPGDAVEITNTEHAALMSGQTQGKVIQADGGGSPVLVDPPVAVVLAQRLGDVSALYQNKLATGYLWPDAPGGPQTVDLDGETQQALDKFALRARQSREDEAGTPGAGRAFKFRFAGRVPKTLTDEEVIEMAKGAFDHAKDFEDSAQDHKDALHSIAEGAGTDDAKRAALTAYVITEGW